MKLFDNLKMYGRFTRGLPGYLRRRITPDEARAVVRRRMLEREDNFLRLLERGIFGHPGSPYLRLLKMADAGLEDIRGAVRQRGLEGTLLQLREAGVYVSFEEFKGREVMVRNGLEIPLRLEDFNNPFLKKSYQGQSGGTTGAGTRIPMDLDALGDHASDQLLVDEAHGMTNLPWALCLGVLPDPSGLNSILRHVVFRSPPLRWFAYNHGKAYRPAFNNRMAMRYIIGLSRLMGVNIPTPEPLALDQSAHVAHWAGKTIKEYGACLIIANVSAAMRIAMAAKEEGIDLTGAVFHGNGEPPTPAKVSVITGSGARWIPCYYFTEAGPVGMGCANPVDGNDLHLLRDNLALITFPRTVPGCADLQVNAFNFTTLLPTAPRILLNTEIDDYGIVEKRACGCPLEEMGYTEHLREIRSFRKLTGEGVTLVGNEMERILDEVLPARFGGSPLDYQFLEEEDERGLTRLYVLVSPKLNIPREEEIITTVLESLRRSSVAADLARVIWSQDGMLRVRRMDPVWTNRCKLMPLHLAVKGEKK